jgi:hypothetical protein
MRSLTMNLLSSLFAGACASAAPIESARANELVFTAALRGDAAPTSTGSLATGAARISVDRETQTVDLALDVTGISIDGLWDQLVQAPIGPIHLHFYYAAHDHALDGEVKLIMPVPFGPAYAATAHGFSVRMDDYVYTDGAALLGTEESFEQFIAALESGAVVLNIHTDAHQDGEISGLVIPAT